MKHSRILSPGKTSKNWIPKEQREKYAFHICLWLGQPSVVDNVKRLDWLTRVLEFTIKSIIFEHIKMSSQGAD